MTDPTSETPETTRLEKQLIASEDGIKAIDLIAGNVPLSKQKIKMAMEKGAVWFKKAKGGRRRLRRAKTELNKGDSIEFNYDAHILASVVPVPQLIADKQGYSVWYKPELMLSQGSKFADHCAITRWVEKNIQPKRAVYLVHRLDRAASGLILIAHNQTSAAKLSRLFSDRKIQKRYTVKVTGQFNLKLPHVIDTPIEGKPAHTEILSAERATEESKLLVEIKTGRKHQIRRHLSEAGWPVVGDKLYGAPEQIGSLKLTASNLQFICPISNKPVEFKLDAELAQL